MRFLRWHLRWRLLCGVVVSGCVLLLLLSFANDPRPSRLHEPPPLVNQTIVKPGTRPVSIPKATSAVSAVPDSPVPVSAGPVPTVPAVPAVPAVPKVPVPVSKVPVPDPSVPSVPDVPSVVVHLDLKGSPPTMAFLHDFLRLSAAEGADGLLIEYEDMFPFEGRLANASARNAYSKDEIKQILIWAKEAGLHVIPLVQTFGHLEYVLKLAEFRHLRELRSFPQELCPSNPESMELVRDILQQVMALHTPDTRFLHMGCDEVFHLNACGRCTQRALSSTQLFVDHVASVARLVRSLFPGVKPLIWDDMLRSIPPADFPDLELSTLVEPVVWAYKTISPSIRDFTWFTYGRTFPRVWAAAAFRGASGAAAYAPNVTERFHNVWDWRRRQLAQGAGEPAPAPAVLVLTGWARYDHFAVLTELLPMSVPSLVLALHVARALRLPPRDKVADDDVVLRLLVEWRRSLSCPVGMLDMPLNNYDPYQWTLVHCSFMGVDVFRVVIKCQVQLYNADILQRKLDYVQGWMTAYHRERGWSSPARALQVLNGAWQGGIGAAGLRARLEECRNETESVLPRYVDAHAVAEWVAQRILPAEKAMRELELDAVRMTEEDEWPRRPID